MKKEIFVILLNILFGILLFGEDSVREVTGVAIEPGVGSLKVTWEQSDITSVDRFELLVKEGNENYKKPKIISKEIREYFIDNLEPFQTVAVKIKTVLQNGKKSKGVEASTIIKHKSVIIDEFEGKKMFIYFPEGYDKDDKKYPVMYMFDGQNLFSKAYAPIEWGIDETVDKLVKENKIEKVIVVGLFHAGDKRTEEYTPYLYQMGKDFAEKIVKRIIPYIEEKYKALPGKENRGVMGSSRGGLMALYMINNYSEYFSFGGGVSASEMWKWKEYKDFSKKDVKIWLDNGTADYVLKYSRSEATRAMVDGYIAQGHNYGKDLVFYEVKNGSHGEMDWAKRVEYPFIMFKGKENGKLIDYTIDIEVYHDNDGKPVFAANPIANFDNGIKYSLYNLAKYSISSKGEIDTKGIFKMNGEEEDMITVSYNGIEKKINVTAKELEKMTKENAVLR